MATALWSIVVVLIACVLGSFGPIYMKRGSNGLVFKAKALAKNKNLWIGSMFYLGSTIMFIPALKFGEVSVLYPIASTSYIWVSLLSIKLLGEKMNWVKWLGVVIIIIGVSFVGLGI